MIEYCIICECKKDVLNVKKRTQEICYVNYCFQDGALFIKPLEPELELKGLETPEPKPG